MEELSLHILDIVQNSIAALASLVRISILESAALDSLVVEIEDDGKGMDGEMAEKVTDPFVTSRSTRKVGLGIPLFKASAEGSGGSFSIKSARGKGTLIRAEFRLSHIDRPPLGGIADTVITLIVCNPDRPDFLFAYHVNGEQYVLDTREVKGILGEVPLNIPDVAAFLKEDLSDGIRQLNGGA